jgi:hypothetical protein
MWAIALFRPRSYALNLVRQIDAATAANEKLSARVKRQAEMIRILEEKYNKEREALHIAHNITFGHPLRHIGHRANDRILERIYMRWNNLQHEAKKECEDQKEHSRNLAARLASAQADRDQAKAQLADTLRLSIGESENVAKAHRAVERLLPLAAQDECFSCPLLQKDCGWVEGEDDSLCMERLRAWAFTEAEK